MVIHFQLQREKNQIPFNFIFLNPEGYFFQISPVDTIQIFILFFKVLSLLLKGNCKSNVDLRGVRGGESSFAY